MYLPRDGAGGTSLLNELTRVGGASSLPKLARLRIALRVSGTRARGNEEISEACLS